DEARATPLTQHCGEGGAIDYSGKHCGLPRAIRGHNAYGDWGPRGATGELVFAIGFTKSRLDQFFGDVQPFETISPDYALPEESGLTVYICRRPRQNLSASWSSWIYFDYLCLERVTLSTGRASKSTVCNIVFSHTRTPLPPLTIPRTPLRQSDC